MKQLFSALFVALVTMWGAVASAQTAWVQIEANPTLQEAQRSAQSYAGRLADVNGFRMASGWYAIALGPYSRGDAVARLADLRRQGAIPGDSFLAFTNQYRQQFWPVGANALGAAPIAAPSANTTAATVEVTPPPPADETRREALASERLIDRPGREALQVALKWDGFYTSGIDGAFGPGTRRAMSDYQAAMGHEVTGVLTTKQRGELLASYQAVIDSLGMQTIQDHDAGIVVEMPSGMVGFSRYEAPFAHYDTKNDSGVRVVLISQTGDQSTLFGLYDILQSLEIVPLEGDRTRKEREFTLTGTDDKITSYTHAKLVDGAVKGFTLIWPNGDEKRRGLALAAMQNSFASLGDVALADNAGLDAATQSLDLLSGLEIRRADMARSGFYVDGSGAILTTTEAVASCERVTINDTYEVSVAALDTALGLALLKPTESLAPIAVAALLTSEPRLKSDVAVAGYSYEGRLSAPTLTFGTLADLKGLKGEQDLSRLALAAQAGDAGGPVLDGGGAVIGMLLPRDNSGAQLPADVSFAADAGALAMFLAENGITVQATDALANMDPVDMSVMAADMTVLVSCWN
ncbi:serine protease [Aliiroseovarius subalbicans]|uniref:serine protease n=1 Tax=Aliiroseovarius subalbicans TaxID=2925840 RepID=UPI001F5ADEED|nr:serine protease [Aliiroseovarius subalbicans]MCI2399322.1 serine protease [Aliiroseovarius subalbicans]